MRDEERGIAKPGHISPQRSGSDSSSGLLRLSESDRVRLIEAGVKVGEDIGSVVKGLVAIQAIRAQAAAEIGRIEAETRSIVEQTRLELELLRANGDNTGRRGEVTVRIIREVRALLEAVPDLDSSARKELIDGLPVMISATLRDQ